MKERIKEYMDNKGKSAGELAIDIGVQRSNISHILNGRNKPGAAFIERMLIRYPDLNARWLLTGQGEMLYQQQNISTTITVSKSEKQEELPFINSKVETPEPVAKEQVHKATEEQPKQIKVANIFDDNVEKVVLLYKDGSFASYNNRSK